MRAATAVLVALAMGFTTTAMSAAPASADVGSVRIGSKNFSGADVLSQVFGQALAAEGGEITFQPDVGPTEATFEQLEADEFDGYGEYQGTLLEFLGGTPTSNSSRTHADLAARLRARGLVVSDPAPAVDVNGFYVTRKTATKYNLTTVSDLRKIAPKLVFGGPPECLTRPLCLGPASQRRYGLQFKKVLSLDAGGPKTRHALQRGNIDVGLLFTSSSVIPKDAVLLRDNKGLQPADNPVMILRRDAATPEVLAVVNSVVAEITTAAYHEMSLDVSVRHRDPADVAATFLAERNLP
ncbi:MAG TPA: ABC transporter substrate-binding protein [Acidimicrobiia bacterium]|jgi:osmoprotectant transport system substrate-binding protein